MNYSVKELRDNLGCKILGLGVTPKFKENTSFGAALVEVDMLIVQMNMFQVADEVVVTEENNSIRFVWNTTYDVNYSFLLTSTNDRTFSCIVTEERKPIINKDGYFQRTKRVVEKVATLTEDGEVILTTNGAIVTGIENENIAQSKSWCDRKIYDEFGVMREREFRTYPENILGEGLDNLKLNSILYVPRQVFVHGFMSDKYETRHLMIRNKLDTAKALVEDRVNNKKFMGEIDISNQHTLRALDINRDFEYPSEVLIKPKSKEEIETMIKSVRNLEVEKGLRKYAIGREEYYYSSLEDKTFVCENGIEVGKKLS